MNKIFKVIYSKTRHCYVVVSELAKSHCKTAGSHTARNKTALTAAVLLALGTFSVASVFMPMTAEAADTTKTDGSNFVGVERRDGLLADSDYANYNGHGAHGDDSITVGLKASGGDGTITIGDRRAEQSLGSVYVGRGPGMPTGKVLPDNTDNGYWATSVGYQSDATGYGSIAIGSNATANNSYDKDSTGHGITLRTTSGDGKTVVLNGKPDIQRASVAIGYGANADNGNIAIGSYSDASTDLRTAKTAAYLTDTTADSYVSVGKSDALRRISNVADGADVTDAATVGQLQALEKKTIAYNKGWGIKIGDYTKKDAAGNETTVKNAISVDRNLGNNSTSVTQVSNTGLILGGDFSGTDQPDEKYGNYGATGQYAVTLGGRSNRASGESSVAAGGMDNTADGNRAFVGGGYQNTASGDRSSAIGGDWNTASGVLSSAIGGSLNTASGDESSAIGGDWNTASGVESSAIGGCENTASGDESSAIGGLQNIASGWRSSAFGGIDNISHSRGSSTLGGMNSVVLGNFATGIAGGSTGSSADFSLAAGSNSVVTVDNGTAIGYQATTNEEGTIAFGHDRGDVSGYTVTWQQRTDKDSSGNIVKNADGTTNDYTKDPTITENTYSSAYYNRLVKVADGKDDHDVVVMEQLKNASDVGNNIKVYKTDENGNVQFDENNKPIEDTSDAATTAKNGSKDAWGKALGAAPFTAGTATTVTNASTSDQLVTGKTLYDYDKPTDSQNYVKVNNTTGQNLSALDAQVKANAVTLNDKTHNIKYYSVEDKISDDKLLPSISGYSNEKNDGAKGAGSMAAGFNTHADGIASTVAGSYSGVVGTGLQGATALSYGTFNINQNTDVMKEHSGVANSIIGQANATIDSNAAIIYGAGNTVTNSYRAIDTSKFDLSKVKQDIAKKDAAAVAKDLQEAVPTSGGQVMVMGGGNSVEKAYMTQVTGVGNTVTGSGEKYDKDSSTQLNYVDGFYTTLTNGKNDYLIGAHNTVTGDSTDKNQSNIVFGDNHKLTNTKNNLILGSSDTADDETTVSDVVSIGHNAKVTKEGGVAIGSGSEATTAAGVAGYDPTGATADTTAAWTSKKAAVSVGTADETRQITGVAAGKEETDAVNVAQLKKLEGMKANVAASNIGANLKDADGKAASADDIKTNKEAWASAIGTGTVASGGNQLVTGSTVYNYNAPVAESGKKLNYVSAEKTTGQNLTALDTQVGTNATNITKNAGDITKLTNLSNITDNGKTVIKDLAKGAVKVAQGDRVTVTSATDEKTGAITYTVSANNTGTVAKGDTNLVSGDTVNTAITNAIDNANTDTTAKLKNKADVDAGNIGTNLKGSDGKAASADDIKTNKEAWASAIGTGTVASGSNQLVTGSAVYNYNAPVAESGKKLNYVSAEKTTGQNLTALDTQVGTNTGDISNLKNLSNISSAGETVIKNLAKGSIGMEDGSHTSVSHRDVNGVETYKVNVTVDGQVAENNRGIVDGGTVYNAIQDVKTKTSADLANKANVDASNLSDDNVKSWQKKLGNGEVVSGNEGLVTGDTVFKAVDTKANRDGSNLTDKEADSFSEKIARGEVKAGENRAVSGDAVSQAISKVTGDMNTKLDGKANASLDNITKDGQNVIRDLAKGSVKVIDGTNTTVTTVEGKGEKPTTYAVNVEGKGTVTSGNTGLISGGTAYTELRPADGTYVKRSSTTAANLSALDTGLKNTSSLIHTNTSGDTIHIGETSKATKVDVSSTDANGNKNGRVVTGVVTDTSDATSAANVGYVNGVTAANTQQIYRDMNNAYSRLDTNINRAAAGSNALAALHPLEFDPADKASFAVGYGHYHNANAAAVGAFYQPNANTMVNMGISLGNGDPGFNAGVSFKIGKGSTYNGVSKAEMAQTIHDQAEEIKTIKANDATKDKRIDALEKENQEMKKQIQEILARLNG